MSGGETDLSSFEASFEELEELVRKLESGTLTLDGSLAHYEQGVRALKRCYSILEVAEKRLELLVRDADGALAVKPCDLAEMRGEARGGARIAPLAQPTPSPAVPPPKVAKAPQTPGSTGGSLF